MNEFVFVEFLFTREDAMRGAVEITDLAEDFVLIKSDIDDGEIDARGYVKLHQRVSGKINSATATAIKLRNTFLSEHMHVSYISDELKNKYRNR